MTPAKRSLVILYGIGGLSDVGRHAILAALEKPEVSKITVITEHPEKLDEKNWDSYGDKTNPFDNPEFAPRLKMVKVEESWKKPQENLSSQFQGADAVISCLGHRQPGIQNKDLLKRGLVAYDGNKQVIQAMNEANVNRVCVITSMGLGGDDGAWKHFAAGILKTMFRTVARKARKDLEAMEKLYVESSLDYLFVRPVGISEDCEPAGKYFIQEPGNKKEVVAGNMAKIDVARFMVDQAINPTFHRATKTVGAEPGSGI
jgi:putative NADH-flavin reductase